MAARSAVGRVEWMAVLLQNAIPLFGVLFLGWSVSLILLLYWLENLTGGLLWTQAIRRHERASGLRGHYRNQLGVSSNGRPIVGFANEYATGAIVFTLAHGLFLGVFALLALDAATLLPQLPWVFGLAAATMLATYLEIGQLTRSLETRPFAWLRAQAQMSLWGVMAMHVGVVFGGFALGLEAGAAIWLALLFIGLRTLVDLMRARARRAADWERPPPLPDVSRLSADLGKATLAKHAQQVAAAARDETVCAPEERPPA